MRRVLLALGVIVTVFGVLHHVDHIVRGNHSGWPFREAVTPFTFSLLVYALLLPGIYMNLRGRVAAGWWVFTASVALALVVLVHFLEAAPIGEGRIPVCARKGLCDRFGSRQERRVASLLARALSQGSGGPDPGHLRGVW